jgi:hypothetical protein
LPKVLLQEVKARVRHRRTIDAAVREKAGHSTLCERELEVRDRRHARREERDDAFRIPRDQVAPVAVTADSIERNAGVDRRERAHEPTDTPRRAKADDIAQAIDDSMGACKWTSRQHVFEPAA